MKCDKIEFMLRENTNQVVKKHFESLLSRYQIDLETLIKGSDFFSDLLQLLYYKCHKINFKCGESYIDFPDWIKKQKFGIIKKRNIFCLYFKTKLNPWKRSNFLNDSIWRKRRMAISKKIICIITWNNFET